MWNSVAAPAMPPAGRNYTEAIILFKNCSIYSTVLSMPQKVSIGR